MRCKKAQHIGSGVVAYIDDYISVHAFQPSQGSKTLLSVGHYFFDVKQAEELIECINVTLKKMKESK